MKHLCYGLLLALIGTFVLSSCVKTDDEVEDISSLWYHTMPNRVVMDGDNGVAEFQIVSDCAWRIVSQSSWLSIQPATGQGSATVRLTAPANPSSTDSRSTEIEIITDDGVHKRIAVVQNASSSVIPPPIPVPVPPLVHIGSVVDVDETTARITATVDESEQPLTSYGFCYGTDSNPAETGQRLALNDSISFGNPFTGILMGLTKNQHYYVCAFASSEAGTSYSAVLEFTTLSIPKEGDLNKPTY